MAVQYLLTPATSQRIARASATTVRLNLQQAHNLTAAAAAAAAKATMLQLSLQCSARLLFQPLRRRPPKK